MSRDDRATPQPELTRPRARPRRRACSSARATSAATASTRRSRCACTCATSRCSTGSSAASRGRACTGPTTTAGAATTSGWRAATALAEDVLPVVEAVLTDELDAHVAGAGARDEGALRGLLRAPMSAEERRRAPGRAGRALRRSTRRSRGQLCGAAGAARARTRARRRRCAARGGASTSTSPTPSARWSSTGCGGARAIADIGSGAGLPGLALAVALPRRRGVPRWRASARKCEFIERAAARLGLENARVVCARAEEWPEGLGPPRPGRSRAPSRRSRWCSSTRRRCCAPGGLARGLARARATARRSAAARARGGRAGHERGGGATRCGRFRGAARPPPARVLQAQRHAGAVPPPGGVARKRPLGA